MKRDIKSELLDLINSAGVRKMDKYSFGLLYKLSIENDLNTLLIGVRQETESIRKSGFINNEKFKKDAPVYKIHFNTDYELIKYLLWTIHGIQLSDIFSVNDIESINIDFYENKDINNAFIEIIKAIRNDSEIEKDMALFSKEKIEEADEIETVLDGCGTDEVRDIIIDKALYSDEIYANNCGYVWDNITAFKILDFKIDHMEEREKSAYSLNVKFQIESHLEDVGRANYYDVEIPRFLIFPSVIDDDNDRQILENNLLLVYNMTEDIIYSMILREFPNFNEYPVTISKTSPVMNIEDFKEEVLSKLAENLAGLFYTGSRNIYMKDDVMKLCNEFMKRSFFDFSKQLFSEFVLSTTGIRINDLNTVNSFYVMIEKIASEFEKEKDDERV